MKELRKELGARIRSVRKNLGLNQKTFGEMLGVGISTVSAYESRGSSPSPEALAKIAEMGGVSVDYLITGKREQGSEKKLNVLASLLMNSQLEIEELFDEDYHSQAQTKKTASQESQTTYPASFAEFSLELCKEEFTLLSLFRHLTEKRKKDALIELAYLGALDKKKY
ncbi:helix-turn-helix domain-containing protein [Desulfuromonas acetoxidans]|uniref:helix-turn-helix domain-containing protein n=1 Tax=Desulfuromonas acetoxidans TaxID=891 RepID=UPI00292E4367|nr:helix-turn-helix domain-containing protein [Desulfuromonas acetoxidans]